MIVAIVSLMRFVADGITAVLRWLGLEIKRTEILSPTRASVEFVARYKRGGRAYRLAEASQFELRTGQWIYLNGTPAE